ncbi:MAG: tryptophan-rich sensory protein [Kiritimatiellales bacterium]|nr:tryptophan-rich sensory protein [Kiritimatiellota bacterium]MBL7012576.1 tryptophan-rich sensory protein [Kiritimatiellales bacterium]
MKGLKNVGRVLLFQLIAFLPSLGALAVRTDGWYAQLSKPAWNPPPAVFGPVWTALYVLIGLAGYFAWTRGGRRGRLTVFAVYGMQLLLNALWTPLFFGLHRPALALADLILMWFLILLCIGRFAPRSRLAAWLMLPYFLWVSFAGALNAAIVWMN